ncbi:MAG: response regulator [bacterium]
MPAKILIIEDEADLLEIYNKKLTESNMEVVTAKDGKSGIEMANKERPNLIILDLMLPEMHGFDVLAEIKKDDNLKDTPIIILTNLNHSLDEKKGYNLGVAEYLIKVQTDVSQLPEIIRKHLKK